MDPGRSKVDQEGKDFYLVCQFECWINIFINILICSVILRLIWEEFSFLYPIGGRVI